MSVSCQTTASTSYLPSGTGVRLTSVSCMTNVSVGLKPESPVPFGIAKPNSHFGLRTKALKNSIQSWNGIKQRKNSWQDGVLGTNCPIPPKSNYTYKFQTKDQIGTYTYFPSTLMHKAAGGFGGLNVYARSVIPVPYPKPAQDFTLLIGDWLKTSHKVLLPGSGWKPVSFVDIIEGNAVKRAYQKALLCLHPDKL